LASSEAIDEANLSIDFTIEPLFSDREFFVFSLSNNDDGSGDFFFFDFFVEEEVKG